MLSRNLQGTLERALMHAQGHTYATPDHLLLALIDDPDAARVLRGCAPNLEDIRNALAMNIKRDYGVRPTDDSGTRPASGFQRAVQLAAVRVQSSGKNIDVNGAHVLEALLSGRNEQAVHFLRGQGVTLQGVRKFIWTNPPRRLPGERVLPTEDVDESEDVRVPKQTSF
jgi:ATP-dependent Clp protease ATP-binding subunit ClpA